MNWDWNQHRQKKNLFRSYYCFSCKQAKPCGTLTKHTRFKDRCCPCYFQSEQENSQEYLDYQTVYQTELKKQQAEFHQLQLLKSYSGCSQCGSKAVEAYLLYEESKLVCSPCSEAKNQALELATKPRKWE